MRKVTWFERRIRSCTAVRGVLAAVAAAALAVSGCASSSTSASSISSTTSTAASATQSAVSNGTYRGNGFVVAIPPGWKRVSGVVASNGNSGIVFGPAGDTKTSITIHSYRQPTEDIDQTIKDVLVSDKAEESAGSMRHVRVSVSSQQVPGASQAKLLSESFVAPAGQVRYVNLVALTPSGAMITVEALAPAAATGFDPASAARSLRITGG